MQGPSLIWFDAATPKYALFACYLVRAFEKHGMQMLITTRESDGYSEATAILKQHGIAHHVIGSYGGQTVSQKFLARLERQKEFVSLFEKIGMPAACVNGCVVDSTQTAFGLGMPVYLLSDTPIAGDAFAHDKITIVSKLTLPLAKKVFYPFVLPESIYTQMGINASQLHCYDFIDVWLWIKDVQKNPQNDFRIKLGLDPNLPTVLIREEEYKAHYVTRQVNTIYDAITKFAADDHLNVVLLPRYDVAPLKEKFGDAIAVLEEKLPIDHLYPFIDCLVGGGGTMNLEAACFGVPVVSTRSLFLYHDRYLMERGLMTWAETADDVVEQVSAALGRRTDGMQHFHQNGGDLSQIVDVIVTDVKGESA